jgi:hypothetical protein
MKSKQKRKYEYVFVMMIIAFALTYLTVWLMIRETADFYLSNSLFYQASFMAVIMGAIEMFTINIHEGSSFPRMDWVFIVILLLAGVWLGWSIRNEMANDSLAQFFREMIPHNSVALRIVEETRRNPHAKQFENEKVFLDQLFNSQVKEMNYMKQRLHQLES